MKNKCCEFFQIGVITVLINCFENYFNIYKVIDVENSPHTGWAYFVLQYHPMAAVIRVFSLLMLAGREEKNYFILKRKKIAGS